MLKNVFDIQKIIVISVVREELGCSAAGPQRQTGKFLKFVLQESYSTVQDFITQHTFLLCNSIFHTCLILLLNTQRILSTLVSFISSIVCIALLFTASQGTSQTDSWAM